MPRPRSTNPNNNKKSQKYYVEEESEDSEVYSSSESSSSTSSSNNESQEESEMIDKSKNYHEFSPDLSSKIPVKTFELKDRDAKTLFCLSYDIARFIGLRDSFTLFVRFPLLTRLWTTFEEREYLVSIHALSPNVKRKNIAIVDVRQVLAVIPDDLLVPSQENEENDSTMAVVSAAAFGTEEDEACIIKRHKPSLCPNHDEITSEELYAQASQSLSPEQMSRLTSSIRMEDKEEKIACIFQAFRFNSSFNHQFHSASSSSNDDDNALPFNICHSNCSYFDSLNEHERQELKGFLENANFPQIPSLPSTSNVVHTDCHLDLFPIPVMKGQYYTGLSMK